jgi:putative IMPACT (imprinted ancient) family translation regulator
MGKTIGLYGEAEIVIQKSRFLCQAKRVETETEAVAFIAEAVKNIGMQPTTAMRML